MMKLVELNSMLKIADAHVSRIVMALQELQPSLPFDAEKIMSLSKENLLFTDLLVHRFGKLQDLLGNKIINEFLISIDEYSANLSMLDKVYKLEKLGVIEDVEIWKEMRRVRNHVTHEYPDNPDFSAVDLNKIAELAPVLINTFYNIKMRIL